MRIKHYLCIRNHERVIIYNYIRSIKYNILKFMKEDFYEYSVPELVRYLGSRFKEYRLRANMTQKEVAEQAGVTVTTIHRFENGAANNVSLGTFFLLLKAVGMIDNIGKLLPELPESPYLYKEEKKVQRIRHKKA